MKEKNKMAEIKYSPQLDGLRAVCIIFTIFNHVDGVPFFIDGNVGVDVFFALSGFLITGILLRSNWCDLKGYYIRRFYRILPVYYLALIATVIFAVVLNHFGIGESKINQMENSILPSLLISRELATGAPTFFGQAWTVGIEEKFYLVWPVIFLAIKNNKARLFLLIFIIGTLFQVHNSNFLRGYAGIALGSMASILYFKKRFALKIHYGFVALCIAYVVCVHFDSWYKNLSISLAAALFIPALYADKSSIYTRVLSIRLMSFVGKLTFSVYMFHVLVLNFVKIILNRIHMNNFLIVFVVGYILSLALAWVIYEKFEKPLINRGKILSAKN